MFIETRLVSRFADNEKNNKRSKISRVRRCVRDSKRNSRHQRLIKSRLNATPVRRELSIRPFIEGGRKGRNDVQRAFEVSPDKAFEKFD